MLNWFKFTSLELVLDYSDIDWPSQWRLQWIPVYTQDKHDRKRSSEKYPEDFHVMFRINPYVWRGKKVQEGSSHYKQSQELKIGSTIINRH